MLSSHPHVNLSNLGPSDHEEDVHPYVKFNDAIRQGHTNVMIWTVDSDVVVSLLAIKFFIANHNGLLQCIFKTLMPGQGNLLIGFGTSRHYRLIPIRQYVEALGPKVDG